jgi:hypothetical protein
MASLTIGKVTIASYPELLWNVLKSEYSLVRFFLVPLIYYPVNFPPSVQFLCSSAQSANLASFSDTVASSDAARCVSSPDDQCYLFIDPDIEKLSQQLMSLS